jgi:O-phosphoseryl-tRNA synthetase
MSISGPLRISHFIYNKKYINIRTGRGAGTQGSESAASRQHGDLTMRLLFIHSAPFSFKATEKTKYAEKIEPPVVSEGAADDAIVVMLASERSDEAAPELVSERAAAEIISSFERVGAKTIVLYPYAHLSNDLANPSVALKILHLLRNRLAEYPLIRCPFGWYKAFELHGRGHPVSELSRVIEIDPKEISRQTMRLGREHPVAALNQRFREVFIELGLDEMINPAIVDDMHVYKQYGPEAPLILDRVFYLAGLDRADIGLSKSKTEIIHKIVPDFAREEELRTLLREYKEALIEADDFLEELALRLKVSDTQAAEIVDRVFPEFKDLKPVVTKRTLRSHMTSNWFPVLQRLRTKWPLPIRLFSVGSRFRREQRQDPHHLFESTSASVVVMDEKLTMDDGKKLVIDVLKRMGFDKCSFKKKKIASRYYDPETDTEVFVGYRGQQIEVGNLGFYAPASLRNYDINLPVFNIGYGVERMAMILSGATDLRSLVYPQFYEESEFTDEELAAMLAPEHKPENSVLAAAAADMVAKAVAAKEQPGPASATIFKGNIEGRDVEISIFNWDDGKPLLSMAAVNRVYVHDSCIYGLPPDPPAMGDKFSSVYERGARTELRFIDMIVAGFAAAAEKAMRTDKQGSLEQRWKIVKRPQQVNLHIPEAAYDFIQRLHKNIRIGGPLFFGLKAEWK